MIEFTHYAGRVQDWRGQLIGLPPWGRVVVGIFAIPGLVLAGLSLVGFVVSILALLLLALPVYVLLRKLTTPGMRWPRGTVVTSTVISPADDGSSPGARRVESTVVE